MAEILVAEDNPADVYLIREALRENGVDCSFRVACDGKEVLKILAGELPGAEELKLIILDLNLPCHDGLEILEHIRSSGFPHIPVVVLTSSDFLRDRQRAIELGAERFLRKPSGLEEFLSLGAIFKEFLSDSQAASESA
jgi:two-component system, chemotaxis family, response regulator Rcp1